MTRPKTYGEFADANELEPHLDELYGNIMKQLREQSVDAEEMLDGLSQDGLQL